MTADYEPPESPVFAHGRGLTPRVRAPSSPLGVAVGAAAVVLIGLSVFAGLRSRHPPAARPAAAREAPATVPLAAGEARAGAPSTSNVPASPPPRTTSAANFAQPRASAQPSTPTLDGRSSSPALVVDFSAADRTDSPAVASGIAVAASSPSEAAASRKNDDKLTADELFAARVGGAGVETAHASKLADLASVATQGTVIPAILETALNSDLPGFARAVVSRDVHGFDGSRVLVPRGSKLIGQYRSGIADGQTRVFVIWSRLLTPAGVSVDIGSPAADPQGRGGLTGEVNEHFFRRFGAAVLLSVLDGAVGVAAASQTASTAIVIGSPVQAANLAGIALQKQINIQPTIKVPQGAPIRVFVARDLDFSDVAAVAASP